MELGLKDKTVVITGGASGIGRAVAEEFLQEGARVAFFGRSASKIDRFLEKMKEAGVEAERLYGQVLDVQDEEGVFRFAQTVFEKFGTIDVWVNNAGIAIDKPFLDYTQKEWDCIMGVNLKGVFHSIQAVSPYMMKQKKGVIINISSYASIIPSAGGAIYAASKAGVSSLTKTLAAELAPYGIRMLGIVPGMINTEISYENIKNNRESLLRNIAMKRLGGAEDLAKPIVFLASDAAGYVDGFDVQITGGKFSAQNTDWPWERKEEYSQM